VLFFSVELTVFLVLFARFAIARNGLLFFHALAIERDVFPTFFAKPAATLANGVCFNPAAAERNTPAFFTALAAERRVFPALFAMFACVCDLKKHRHPITPRSSAR
jgi:hypothetical protein